MSRKVVPLLFLLFCFGGCVASLDSSDSSTCLAPPGQSCELPECDNPCAFNDLQQYDQACKVSEPGQNCGDLRGERQAPRSAGASVAAPGAFFKSSDLNLQRWVQKRWQEVADMTLPAAVKSAITQNGGTPHNYTAGNGFIRTDFHGNIFKLPKNLAPATLLSSMLTDINRATGASSDFDGWVTWPKAGAGGRKLGEVVDLDIYGPDNGAVAYTKLANDFFCVITVENASAGWHPVNGIRCWGFVPIQVNPNWMTFNPEWRCGGPFYMFYTVGIDSPSIAGSGGPGSTLQAGTWNALIRDLSTENVKAGGLSGRYMLQKTITQSSSLVPRGTTKAKGPGALESQYITLPSGKSRAGETCDVGDAPLPGTGSVCTVAEYTCADAVCVQASQRCDGNPDCAGGEDEQACGGAPTGASCDANQFSCDDGTCIPEAWRCDGQYEDCASAEDEADCVQAACTAAQYTCGDGTCIDSSWVCDGFYTDCESGEDEANCPGADGNADPAGCDSTQYTCTDGSCIPQTWVCDGEYSDCEAGEDEANCPASDAEDPPTAACTSDQFTCNDGLCIISDWVCDGEYADCEGGEDEVGCT